MSLSRRALLRGAGVAIGLPMLEAMVPTRARAQTMSAPRRAVWFYNPIGADMSRYTPSGIGADWQPSFSLQPLVDAGLKSDVSILTGLSNAAGNNPNGHQRAAASFLTATSVPATTEIMNDISADQVAANAIGQLTPIRSLQLGLYGGALANGNSQGYPYVYNHSISYRGPGQPLPNETSPRKVFERLFVTNAGLVTQADVDRKKRYQHSILDFVRGDANRLQAKLAGGDRAKIDQYLTGIRELEMRIDNTNVMLSCNAGDPPTDAAYYPERIQQMLDLIVLALSCDVTRVITFMRYSEGAADGALGPYSWVIHTDGQPLDEGFHALSHHGDADPMLAKCASINRWETTNLVYLLNKLKTVSDGDGTLLDNTAVACASPLGNSHWHDCTNPPFVLAGRCGGAFNPGRHIRFSSPVPTANVWISMLQALGVQQSTFGQVGTGPISEL